MRKSTIQIDPQSLQHADAMAKHGSVDNPSPTCNPDTLKPARAEEVPALLFLGATKTRVQLTF